eukprot:1161479-Pelagomonas_calceolata.AAC.15
MASSAQPFTSMLDTKGGKREETVPVCNLNSLKEQTGKKSYTQVERLTTGCPHSRGKNADKKASFQLARAANQTQPLQFTGTENWTWPGSKALRTFPTSQSLSNVLSVLAQDRLGQGYIAVPVYKGSLAEAKKVPVTRPNFCEYQLKAETEA